MRTCLPSEIFHEAIVDYLLPKVYPTRTVSQIGIKSVGKESEELFRNGLSSFLLPEESLFKEGGEAAFSAFSSAAYSIGDSEKLHECSCLICRDLRNGPLSSVRTSIAMHPVLRHTLRPIFDSSIVLKAPRPSRQLSASSPIRASTCLQCQFRSQRRHYADDTKPKSFTTPPDTSLSNSNNGQHSPSSTEPELPSASDSRRSAASKRLSHLMDNMQSNIFHASQRLNDLTGYSGIEALKASIAAQEHHLDACQEAVRCARQTYKTTVTDRAASQREVTTLLARKDTWSPADLERFTSLYRSDHGNEQAVQEAAAKLADAERVAEQAANKLSTSILRRYHEEQIWSDKIRRMSTWGTWGLMGVNVLIFLVFQFGFEPWRRRRLVRGFEEKVHEALEREKERQGAGRGGKELDEARLNNVIVAGLQELEMETDTNSKDQEPACDALAAVISNDAIGADGETTTASSKPTSNRLVYLRRPETWKSGVLDLFSDRVVSLRQQDVTIITLEGAATGAAFVGLIMMYMFRST
jgi:sensitive to high expression protein 9